MGGKKKQAFHLHSLRVVRPVHSRGCKLLVRKLNSDKQLSSSAGALIEIEPNVSAEEQSESTQNESAIEKTVHRDLQSSRLASVAWIQVEYSPLPASEGRDCGT